MNVDSCLQTLYTKQSGEPIPADLGVVSSDDEDDRDDSGNENRSQSDFQYTDKPRRKAPDASLIPAQEMAGNPYPKLNGEGASDLLQNRTNLLLAHAGFDGEFDGKRKGESLSNYSYQFDLSNLQARKKQQQM